jgi:hypothetical protein
VPKYNEENYEHALSSWISASNVGTKQRFNIRYAGCAKLRDIWKGEWRLDRIPCKNLVLVRI